MAQDTPYAAGVLPWACLKGRVIFLVGRDAQDGTWSDFGGKHEARDRSELETAQREFYEETCGTVMDLRALKTRMNCPQTFRMLVSTTQSKHPYFMYLLEIPFDASLRTAFRKTVAYLRFAKVARGMVEKTDVQWVTLEQLRRMDLRSIFGQTLRRHEATLEKLAAARCMPPD